MNNARSTCVTVTLLLVAVSLAFTGYSLVCRADCATSAGSRDRADTTPGPMTEPGPRPTPIVASDPGSCLTTAEVEALDVQLRAIEDELESLAISGESDGSAIEGGLK